MLGMAAKSITLSFLYENKLQRVLGHAQPIGISARMFRDLTFERRQLMLKNQSLFHQSSLKKQLSLRWLANWEWEFRVVFLMLEHFPIKKTLFLWVHQKQSLFLTPQEVIRGNLSDLDEFRHTVAVSGAKLVIISMGLLLPTKDNAPVTLNFQSKSYLFWYNSSNSGLTWL